MGRPKTYDRESVTRKAMELFWAQGYEATSTRALAEHMGINVYSLFSEFKSKQGLYEAALALYRTEVVARVFAQLETPDAGFEEVDALLRFFSDRAGAADAGRGCLACNAASERAGDDSASHTYVMAHIAHIEAGIRRALTRARKHGELRADVSCRDQSRLLTAVLLGFSLLMRAGTEPTYLKQAVRAARADLRRLRA